MVPRAIANSVQQLIILKFNLFDSIFQSFFKNNFTNPLLPDPLEDANIKSLEVIDANSGLEDLPDFSPEDVQDTDSSSTKMNDVNEIINWSNDDMDITIPTCNQMELEQATEQVEEDDNLTIKIVINGNIKDEHDANVDWANEDPIQRLVRF